MKKIKYIYGLIIMAIMAVSCTPDSYELGSVDVKPGDLIEGVSYTVTHDAENPNIVYLTSLMGAQYTALWTHPQGRSQEQMVTLRIAFPGTYTVRFGVETRGGVVYAEKEAEFVIEDMYAGFISDPMWVMLAGGAGESKTWYIDLDADELSRYFKGPIYFFNKDYTWDALHTTEGVSYLDDDWKWDEAVTPLEDPENPGTARWYWLPDWAGNEWTISGGAADFGSMTFDLMGAANVTVDQEDYGFGLNKGSFLLDVDAKTISFTDVNPLRTNSTSATGSYRILHLTDDVLQIAFVTDDDMRVVNYISEDYRNNWAPDDTVQEPPYEGDANDDLTTNNSTTRTWTVNMDAPYNWANLKGELLNSWTVGDDGLPTMGWGNPYDEGVLSNVSITLSRGEGDEGTYRIINGQGQEYTGTYTIDDKNRIDFGQDITILNNMGGWVTVATDDGKLRIIDTQRDATGRVTVLHLGRMSGDNEYIVITLV